MRHACLENESADGRRSGQDEVSAKEKGSILSVTESESILLPCGFSTPDYYCYRNAFSATTDLVSATTDLSVGA